MPYRPAVAFMKNYTARHDWLPGVPLEEIGNLQVWPGGREGRRGVRPPPPEPEGCRVGAVAGLLARGISVHPRQCGDEEGCTVYEQLKRTM